MKPRNHVVLAMIKMKRTHIVQKTKLQKSRAEEKINMKKNLHKMD